MSSQKLMYVKMPIHTRDPIQSLVQSMDRLITLTMSTGSDKADFYLLLNKLLIDFFCEVRNCEQLNYSRETILKIIKPIRTLFGKSNTIKRMQTWPRGYPGDFETIEYLYHYRNAFKPGTLEYLLENWVLNLPITQQHRNKLKWQSDIIKETVLKNDQPKTIGILACGGCIDLRNIQSEIANHTNTTYVLNDMDKHALLYAKEHLTTLKDIQLIQNHVTKALEVMKNHNGFDLIVTGGLFDYFDTSQMTNLIISAFDLLKPDGKLFFTNIAKENPYRIIIEYGANWFVIEKDENELLQACNQSHINLEKIKIQREETGLTYLVTVQKEA